MYYSSDRVAACGELRVKNSGRAALVTTHGNVDATVHMSCEPEHDTWAEASSAHGNGLPWAVPPTSTQARCGIAANGQLPGATPQVCSSGLRKLECRASSSDARKPFGTRHRPPKNANAEACLRGGLYGFASLGAKLFLSAAACCCRGSIVPRRPSLLRAGA